VTQLLGGTIVGHVALAPVSDRAAVTETRMTGRWPRARKVAGTATGRCAWGCYTMGSVSLLPVPPCRSLCSLSWRAFSFNR